jgi:hypothetical protein
VGSLEDRLRKLEERLVLVPSIDAYLDASNRQQVRALAVLVERLEKYGFDSDYLFTEENRRMLAEDTREERKRDRETVEAWHRAQGIDLEMGTEGAKEKLLARLDARGKA